MTAMTMHIRFRYQYFAFSFVSQKQRVAPVKRVFVRLAILKLGTHRFLVGVLAC